MMHNNFVTSVLAGLVSFCVFYTWCGNEKPGKAGQANSEANEQRSRPGSPQSRGSAPKSGSRKNLPTADDTDDNTLPTVIQQAAQQRHQQQERHSGSHSSTKGSLSATTTPTHAPASPRLGTQHRKSTSPIFVHTNQGQALAERSPLELTAATIVLQAAERHPGRQEVDDPREREEKQPKTPPTSPRPSAVVANEVVKNQFVCCVVS